jgi:hypothetical protein
VTEEPADLPAFVIQGESGPLVVLRYDTALVLAGLLPEQESQHPVVELFHTALRRAHEMGDGND